jgi:bifunctional non-homologous end joining protein LigD
MGLKSYRQKRDFKETSEPKGKVRKRKTDGPIFVVQKHDASRLHYDFRLEVDGTLKSWAVPKGPPKKASDKRLAVMVEDHPLEYGNFEGEIPEGHYGAGTVEIWDRGTYENIKDYSMDSSIKKGQIEVELKGKKLKGPYALVRTKLGGKDKNWLLIKMKKK